MTSQLHFLYNQLLITPRIPANTTFTNQTLIVTGSNTGLGLRAAEYIVSLGASKVILAVRSPSAGETAKQQIEAATQRTGVVEVWPLDLNSYASVLSFADRVNKDLPRLDAVIENAGIASEVYRESEGHERSVTVNVISTFLLAVLLVPKLRETGKKYPSGPAPRLCILASEVHAWTKFPERKADDIFAALDEGNNMAERYPTTKLLDVLLARELAGRVEGKGVVVNIVNPGFCKTKLGREFQTWGFWALQTALGRTAEVGSRTLVCAAAAGWESHGEFMSDGVVSRKAVSAFVKSEEGGEVQRRLWGELEGILEGIRPGVLAGLRG
ncbi:putative short-chain dehydrogenase/reductase family protein [Aspergillus ellipticus CBS 707.79]|uniref:Putative short-chain dehydrogenase/reductase family protein n=1 Tax=Aspergillus ellipticus CBS 707.79 TaxID=1448320 RepID=A0A319DLQ0_9EURO|nr:putative short-chain dehydrogenase/reductase family protein [Aspergillus ellipticus CBS 707.79]